MRLALSVALSVVLLGLLVWFFGWWALTAPTVGLMLGVYLLGRTVVQVAVRGFIEGSYL